MPRLQLDSGGTCEKPTVRGATEQFDPSPGAVRSEVAAAATTTSTSASATTTSCELAPTSHLARLIEAWNRGLPATLASAMKSGATSAEKLPLLDSDLLRGAEEEDAGRDEDCAASQNDDISGGAEHEKAPSFNRTRP